MRKKEAIGIVLLTTVALIVTVSLFSLNKSHTGFENRSTTPITAADLTSAYQSNEYKANAMFLNKALEVSGSVSSVDRNEDGGSMVLLDSGSPDAPVQCTMRMGTIPLAAGAHIKLKGFCTGSNLSGVTLTDCIVAVN